MLGHEYRMPAHWRLPAVVGRLRCGEAAGDEIAGMVEHNSKAALAEIGTVVGSELKLLPEWRTAQSIEDAVEITHHC